MANSLLNNKIECPKIHFTAYKRTNKAFLSRDDLDFLLNTISLLTKVEDGFILSFPFPIIHTVTQDVVHCFK